MPSQLKLGNVSASAISSLLVNAGIPYVGNVIGCYSSSSGANNVFLQKYLGLSTYGSISAAHSATVDSRNDVVLLTPESHSQAAAVTWSRNMTHLIGMYPNARTHHRSRIGHSANFATLLTVSGYGNLFQNLYFMHGRGSATNVNCVTVSGSRNTFKNVSFSGPFHATEGGTAGYDTVRITGSENYFENCWFGAETVNANAAIGLLEFGTTSSRNIFKNCTFHVRATNAGVFFIHMLGPGGNNRHNIFEDCQFINWGTTTMTVGISWDATCGSTDVSVYFDNNCSFAGCTDVVAAAYEGDLWWGAAGGYISADTDVGLADHPNHTT